MTGKHDFDRVTEALRLAAPWIGLVGAVVAGAILVGPSDVDKKERYLCQASLIIAEIPAAAETVHADPEWEALAQRALDEIADRLDALHPPPRRDGSDLRVATTRSNLSWVADALRAGRAQSLVQTWKDTEEGYILCDFACWSPDAFLPPPEDCT